MYALMVESPEGRKEIVNHSLLPRNDQSKANLMEYKAHMEDIWPSHIYTVVKIDYEVVE